MMGGGCVECEVCVEVGLVVVWVCGGRWNSCIRFLSCVVCCWRSIGRS